MNSCPVINLLSKACYKDLVMFKISLTFIRFNFVYGTKLALWRILVQLIYDVFLYGKYEFSLVLLNDSASALLHI